MKKNTPVSLSVAIAIMTLALMWQACNKNNRHPGCGGPMPGNEPTTVMLVFKNVNNPSDIDTAVWTDVTINSNTGPVIDNSKAHLTLSANASYHVQVFFLDVNAAINSSAYNVTPTVGNESSAYLVCFNDSTDLYGNLGAGLNWIREDLDNGSPRLQLGLIDSFWTGADSTVGLLQTTLHHQYQVKNGDCAPGSIDIQALDTVYISPNKG